MRAVTREIQADIEAIEKNSDLYREANFGRRLQAIDYLEFHVIDRIEGLLQTIDPSKALIPLKQRARSVKSQLEEIDDNLFRRLRQDIRLGGCRGTALKSLIDEYVGHGSRGRRRNDESGYDSLDVFLNGLLLIQPLPTATKPEEPGLVFYQQTPARIIFQLVEKAHLTRQDAFCDLGSGLGHVPILLHLLTGAAAKGIEFEPAYCDYARACAADLNLSGVEFINVDARTADYSEANVFFMYTPFEGHVLQEVLERLREESRSRTIRLFTYGPCTAHASRQAWLCSQARNGEHIYKLGVFTSL